MIKEKTVNKLGLAVLFSVSLFAGVHAQKNQNSILRDSRENGVVRRGDTTVQLKKMTDLHKDETVNLILEKIKEGDSLVYQLDDDSYASALDAKWIEELTTESLYDSITEMVQEQDLGEIEYSELPTDTLKKRLARLNAITPFDIEYNPYLERVIKNYLKRHRPAMERLMGLSHFYFPGFEETLDKYDLPLELKYLAVVESALRPRVRSRAGATGMWQFMYATAKIHDLEINSYVDERMDPERSTEAASEYLSRLYEIFEDWDLALAAYNSGPGNVSKAIRRSGGYKNYWNLRPYLPRETAGYVPAFYAFIYVFEYAKEHGYNPEKPQFNYFLTDTVHIKESLTLNEVSEFTGVSLAELEYLNPVYKLNIIPKTEDDQYALRLPRKEVGKFVYNEDAIYATVQAKNDQREKTLPELLEQAAGINYRVKSGDFLGRIANRYGVGISQIKQWNNLRSNKLKIGQRLLIYPK
ncbi:lytic transglycosylase domain-containing protein [Flavimarina sp. Hel_I_48]|uniref:lytic transglycosylase domain-containing protein n=1 Tax=Flavimarina sp. Hel_I_48 TaxID=1392488 RepID=UPI00068F397E|nr:lytic transglycosylase domain-containing protein [Flavimarina sp. Hel_I_48]